MSPALFIIVAVAHWSLTQGYVKVSLLNRYSFGADNSETKFFKCYISETNPTEVRVRSGRVVKTRNDDSWYDYNPEPTHQIQDSTGGYSFSLKAPRNGSFGIFACNVTLNGETTSVQTILLRSDAYIVPRDQKLTKTVNIGESNVEIVMQEETTPRERRERSPKWRKDNLNPPYAGENTFGLSVPVLRSGAINKSDAGVYECHHNHRRILAVQGLQRLIVRACPSGRWGPPSCSGVCDYCYHGGVCEDNTGDCICPAGFKGANCLTACLPGRFGFECELSCIDGPTNYESACRGAMICLPDPFGCRCASGYEGLGCETSCDRGFFGANCEQSCNCQSGRDCNDYTGECTNGCWSGFTGGSCQECGDGLFGEDCDQECHCEMPCHHLTGDCNSTCTGPWMKLGPQTRTCQTGVANITFAKVNPNSPVEIFCTLSSPIYIQHITAKLRKVTSSSMLQDFQTSNAEKSVSGISAIVSITSSSISEGDEIACVLAASFDSYNGTYRSTNVSYYVLPTLSSSPCLVSATNTSITISWTAWDETIDEGDPPLVGYEAYLKNSSGRIIKTRTVTNTTTQLTFGDLESNEEYTFSVSAIREGVNGIGPESQNSSARTNCSSPLHAPINMAVTEVTSGSVEVTWETPQNQMIRCATGVHMYTIYYKMVDSNEDLEYPVDNDLATSAQIKGGFEAGQSYTFLMTLTTAGGKSPLSEQLNLTMTVPTRMPVKKDNNEAGMGQENRDKAVKETDPGILLWILIALLVAVVLILVVIFLIVRRKRDSSHGKYPQGAGQPDNRTQNPVYDTSDLGRDNTYANNIEASLENNGSHQASVAPLVLPKRSPVPDWEQDEVVEDLPGVEESVYGNLEKPEPVKVASLPDYVARKTLSKTDSLIHQFMILSKDERHSCTVARKEGNKKKNRFRNMLPYDNTRVVLDLLPDVPHSDYYNACYMKDQNGEVAFIASQGPNKASIDDFWRMMWMTDVSIIVMVTNLIEGGKDRCTQYWPEEENQLKQWGKITLSWTGTQQFANHIIRELTVLQGDVCRMVYQYHFVTWPDMGVPVEPTALISLVRQVKRRNQGKTAPILVHCSAGIGRTGTFIALYCLTEVLNREKYINVYEFVEKMREDRVNMVQTAVQYQFLYDALVEVHLTSHTEIPTGLLAGFNIQSKKQLMQEEYKLLNDLSKDLKLKNTAGQEPDNVVKNRFPDIIPPDHNRAFISTGGGYKENDYINATIISSYVKKDAFITTQSPLPHTIEGYWRLVCDWKVPVIVMLNQLDGTNKKCPRYWPEDGPLEYRSITVTKVTQENRGPFIYRQFEVTMQGRQAWYVDHFQLLSWLDSEQCPSGLPELLHSAHLSLAQHPKSPRIIQCIDGVGCSGSVAVVLSEIDRIRAEDRVDIFQSARQLRTSNGHFLHKEHHYILCYKILQEYLGLHTEYGNI